MTFSLINELRKDLESTEQLITYHSTNAEYYTVKHAQLLEAIRILEANELIKALTNHMRDLTPDEEKAHANVLNSIGEVEEENIFDEKPKRRIYTIRSNEPLVKLIIPANKYESYRNFYPNDAIEVCVENDVILYAADSELEYDWRLSLTKEQNPQLFDDVLDMLEREEAMNAFRGKVKPITGEMLLEHPQHVRCELVPQLKPPEWNYNGVYAIEVASTKEKEQ